MSISRIIKKGILTGMIATAVFLANAQEIAEEGPAPISKGISASLHIGTAGSGFGLNYWKGEGSQKLQGGLRVFGIRDSREIKVESVFAERGSKFVFGKVSRFFVATPYIGLVKEIVPADRNNIVSLSVSGQIGPALGFTRPYYLDIEEQATLGLVPPEPAAYDPDKHSYENIVGVSSFVDSRWDMAFSPGISSRIALIVDVSRREKSITALELGVNADYFFREGSYHGLYPQQEFFRSRNPRDHFWYPMVTYPQKAPYLWAGELKLKLE